LIENIFNNKKSGSYIFYGIDGVGKLYNAINLAKAYLCGKFPACNVCTTCNKVNNLNHTNLVLIEPDNKDIKIEKIRDLIKDLYFKPLENNYRFIIINKAHKLNLAAANALLKTLEEPPSDTLFILCTNSLSSLLPTIISRSKLLKFAPLSKDKIANILNIDKNHNFLEFSNGSISTTSFYLEYEDYFINLLNLLENPKHCYIEISKLSSYFTEKLPNSIESLEINYNFIISYINKTIKNCLNNKNHINTLLKKSSSINKIMAKAYYNVPLNIALENILITYKTRNHL